MLSKYVMFNENSMLRPNSQQVESIKTKAILQHVENGATLHSPIGSILFEI